MARILSDYSSDVCPEGRPRHLADVRGPSTVGTHHILPLYKVRLNDACRQGAINLTESLSCKS